jgi:hypothetical protein
MEILTSKSEVAIRRRFLDRLTKKSLAGPRDEAKIGRERPQVE